MNFEICTDCVEGAMAAEKYGAKRIELCSALSVGGLTPSFGLIQQCVENSSVEVHVMIRHKEGGFVCSELDINLMKVDISMAKQAGATGVVFGILTAENTVSNKNKELLNFAKQLNLEVTFHRAFDFLIDYKKGIECLINFGFDRLLTSGLKKTAEEGLEVISYLQQHYGNQLHIMAGSGINSSNALKFATIGVNNLHFTARKPISFGNSFSMGDVMVVDEEKIRTITNLF